MSARRVLDNDPANPCVGCGPEHPAGLRLVFAHEDDAVTTTLEATAARQGWPGRLHSGLLYLAMLETANWTLYGLRGRVGIPTRTSALETTRWVAVGERLLLRGRMTRDQTRSRSEGDAVPEHGGARAATIEVEALDERGARVARIERAFELPPRAEFLRRMGYDRVPAGLEQALPE